MTYAEKLKDPRWQKKRLEIFNRDDWCCRLCKTDKESLSVHHLKYLRNPWDAKNTDLVTLCQLCHELIEAAKRTGIFDDALLSKLCKDGFYIIVVSGSPQQEMANKNHSEIKKLINPQENGDHRKKRHTGTSKN